MTDYKHKENTGKLFKNNKKATAKSPEYTGSCTIKLDGMPEAVEAYMSVWNDNKGAFNITFKNKPSSESKAQPE